MLLAERMVSARHPRWVWAGLLLLSGCAAFEGPQPSATEHTICYTRLETNPDQLRDLAKQACNGATPRFVSESLDLSACPVLVPERARFACA